MYILTARSSNSSAGLTHALAIVQKELAADPNNIAAIKLERDLRQIVKSR